MYIETFLYRSHSSSAMPLRVFSLTFVSVGVKHIGLGNNENFVLQMPWKISYATTVTFSHSVQNLWVSCSNRINVINFR
jgi:hypothetical protein